MDLRFAWRALRRHPGFTAAAVLTLALGIGATAAILSVVDGVLLRPLPYPNADRVVTIWTTGRAGTPGAGRTMPTSAANFVDLRAGQGTLERMAAFRSWTHTLVDGPDAELISGARVSAGFFEALGVTPAMGRVLRPADEQVGSAPVAILSDALWRRRFGADPAILGRAVTLDGRSFTVIGVMGRGFHFPRGAELPAGYQFGARTDLWTPLAFTPGELGLRGLQNLAALGLPRPGVDPDQVSADLAVVMGRLAEEQPGSNRDLSATATPLLETAVATVRPALVVLLGAVGFLLLIACVNVSNLLLTRTAGRSREVAVRAALGAGRGRLARQFIVENLLLAGIGGALGVGLAVAGTDLLLAIAPADLPRRDDIALDWRVVGAMVAVVVGVGLGFGALATREAGDGSGFDRLREGARGSGGRAERRLRNGLVVLEVAISVVLLASAGVLGRTFLNLRAVDPGFRAEGLLTARISLPRPSGDFSRYFEIAPTWARYFRDLTDRLAAEPGIEAAAVATHLPLSGGWESSGFAIEGRSPADPSQSPSALFTGVSDGYFRAMGIRLLAGRTFDARERDSTAAAVVISESLAKRYWPEEDPLGRRIRMFFGHSLEVVGVVSDLRFRDLGSEPTPMMYLPLALYPAPAMTVVIASRGDPMAEVATVRRLQRGLDPAVPPAEVSTIEATVAGALAEQRMSATLVLSFAVAALGLAVLGLYGVISYGVARRSREIAVRLALGAAPRALLGMVLREGGTLALVGIAIGVGAAAVLGRLLAGLVYGVSPTDPVTLGGVAALLAGVGLAAAAIPARRAMRFDPAVVLRDE